VYVAVDPVAGTKRPVTGIEREWLLAGAFGVVVDHAAVSA
jgi:hypothetical protein